MRELKFRAWDTKEKRYTDAEIFISNHSKIYRIFWQELEPANDSEIIVELSTGLKDKNGKEIYEGDIVICSFGESGVVELRHGAYCVVGDDITDMSNWKESAYEVIGNIHESPELLEAKNDH